MKVTFCSSCTGLHELKGYLSKTTQKTLTATKDTFAAMWDLHTYPIGIAESALSKLNTYVAKPLISAGCYTKTYLKNHYTEVLTHLVAWSILFCLCGVLNTRSLVGLSSITKLMFIGVGPGMGLGVIASIIASRANLTPNDPAKGGFAKKVQEATQNIFLRAACGATYMLAAGTIPLVVGGATGVFLGYKLVQHIIHYPERERTPAEKIEALEKANTQFSTHLETQDAKIVKLEEQIVALQKAKEKEPDDQTHQLADLLLQASQSIRGNALPPEYPKKEQ